MPRYSGYTVSLNNAGVALTQVDSWTLNPGTRRAPIIPAGVIDPAHIGIAGANPTINITTRDLVAFWAGVSPSVGLSCASSSIFVYQERSDGGTFIAAATNTHETLTCATGFIYPTTLSASQDGNDGATVEATFVPLWNGTVQPVVWNTGQVISTVTAPAFGSRFFLGPVYHSGAEITGVTNVTIDFGIEFSPRAFSGDPYPRTGCIVTRQPTITFTVCQVAAAAALSTIFGSAITTGIVVYLQKGVASGTRVAVATAQHCKITAASGDWSLNEASVQQNDDGSVSFIATPTTALTAATNSAIP
jgi:hypothetical protein